MIPLSSEDGSITKPYIYYCNTKGDSETPSKPETPAEPEKPQIVVGGLQYNNGLTKDGTITLSAATIADANAWKCVAESQGKVYVDTKLLANKQTVKFSVYLATPGVGLALGDEPEFAIREKLGDENKRYITYGTKQKDENYKLTANTWMNFTIDISGYGTSCTEFSFIIPSGGTIYLKDITIE